MTEQPEDMIFSAFSWDIFLKKKLYIVLWRAHLPGLWASRSSLVVPLGSSCCPVATHPQTGVSILTLWLCTDVSEPRPLFCASGTFQQAKKKKKTINRRPCCLDGPARLSNLPRRREDVRACDAEAVCAVRASGSNAGSTGRKEGRAPLVFTLPLGRLDRENKL